MLPNLTTPSFTSTHGQTNSTLTLLFMLFFPLLPPHVTVSRRSYPSHGSLLSLIHDLLEPLQRQQLPANLPSSSRLHQQTYTHLKATDATVSSSRRLQFEFKTLSVLQHAFNDIPDVFNRPTRRQLHCCCTIADELLLFRHNIL